MTAPSTPRGIFTAGNLLAAFAVALPPLAVMVALGLAPLLAVVALTLLIVDGRRLGAGLRALYPLPMLLGALALWAAASSLWSILPGHSLFEGLRLLVISAEGLIVLAAARALTARERRDVGIGAAIGVALAAALLLIEWSSGAALTRLTHPAGYGITFSRFDRGATTLVLLLGPALLGLRRVPLLGAALTLMVILAVGLMSSFAAMVALGFGIVIFIVARWLPRVTAGALAIGLIGVAAIMPIATPSYESVVSIQQRSPDIRISALHRLLIWRFAADKIGERPLLGWGMDASREMPGGHRDFATLPGIKMSPGHEALPLHPHNAVLQWELELGVPGTLLCLAIICWGLWRIGFAAAMPPTERGIALAYAGAALIIALVSYGIWQAWWLSCLWLSGALLAGSMPDEC